MQRNWIQQQGQSKRWCRKDGVEDVGVNTTYPGRSSNRAFWEVRRGFYFTPVLGGYHRLPRLSLVSQLEASET